MIRGFVHDLDHGQRESTLAAYQEPAMPDEALGELEKYIEKNRASKRTI